MQSSSGGKNRRINEVQPVRAGKAKLQALTKQANQRSKEDWENTFNAISDWVAITDLKGRILRTNTIAEKFTGVAMSEIVGQSCCKLVHGSEGHIPGCPVLRMLDTRQRESVELRVPGSGRWLLVTADPVVDNGGNLIAAVHITRDITERKKAEEELRVSEDKYRLLFENANDAIYLHEVSREGPRKIFAANEAVCRMLGYTREELLRMTIADIDVPEQTEKIPAILDRLFSEGNAVFETEHMRKDGSRVQVLVSIRTFDLHGTMVMLSIVRDITERKRAEKAVAESEKRSRSIFEHANDAIIYLDSFGTILDVNERAAQIFGGSREEVLNTRFTEIGIFSAEDIPVLMSNFEGIVTGRQPNVIITIKNKKGREFTLECSASLTESDGEARNMMVIARDITERRKAEIRETLAHDTLALLNGSQDTTGTIASILQLIKQSMGFEAIGVRLREGEDFPYYETKGFSEDFVLQERYLCARDDKGNIIRDIEGNAVLECMCGNILSGRFDANLPFFTESGSFWTNSTTDLLASTTEKERQSRTRNRCNTAGYESVALIPLKAGSSVIGLLQINDRKRNFFTLDIIHFFEGLGASIGIAFSRKKAEQLLRESENKHRTLLENLPQKIFLKDTNSVYISCNENYARDLKITPEQIVGKTDYDFYPKELAKKYRADDKRIISSGQSTEIEEKYIQDGQEVTVHTVKTQVRDGQGNIAGVLGIFWDITEHKKAQDALRESEEKYRDLFENARDAIVTTDEEARITGVNKLVEEYGFKKEQLLGKSIFDFIVEEHKERALEDFKAAISGNPVRGEMEVITPRGIFTAEYIDNPIKRAGEIVGIQAVLRDVTERKRAEQLLRKERDRAKKYLDVAGVMLVAIDSEQRVGLINKKGCEILGHKEEEILGKNWFNNFLPERVRREVQAVFQRLMCQQGQTVPERHENPILTKSGDERLMAWHNTVLRDDAGKVIAALGSGEDITEQRKAEQKSLQYQSQLRSVASQLTVAEERERYRIATELHDQIGQSLTISKIRVDTLHHSMKTGEHAKVLEEVCNCLSKAIGQVRSLTFDLSSPILHQLGFEAAVGSWLAEEIEAKHHISTIFEDDEQAKPLDDDVRTILFRNVRELLINVVKHAKTHKVRVSVRKIGSQIQVDVQDDGVGFDPTEALAEAARKDKFGLFSVKERLEQIGGRFQIESEPGHGCIATMTAPLKKEGEINDGRI